MNLTQQEHVLNRILQTKLPIDLPPDLIHPQYDGYSILNIPSSIMRWLNVEPIGSQPLANEIFESIAARKQYRHVILLLIDGLGYDWLQIYLQNEHKAPEGFRFWNQILAQSRLSPLSSISPSTTSAALSSFWTGASPAAHGILGYEVWLKELGIISNMILHSPAASRGAVGSLYDAGMDVATFLPVPTIGPRYLEHGVKVRSFQHRSIVNSGLSNMLTAGADVVPFNTTSELWVNLEQTFSENNAKPSYNWVYWSSLDSHSHHYGPNDPHTLREFEHFGFQLLQWIEHMKQTAQGDTLLLITADHGHLYTPDVPDYNLSAHPALFDALTMLPSGENRLAYLYPKGGAKDSLRNYIETNLGSTFPVRDSEAMLSGGLFGSDQIYEQTIERLGDLILFPRDDAYLWWAGRKNPLKGRHGGLSRTEMVVPLIGIDLT
ncbi:MAG: alkaline phosphatase family protein [Anaerolineaceae bacterium]|nr:alkaline phosphatase family protein [Anaerolineaceae bacterium]